MYPTTQSLTPAQVGLVEQPLGQKIFLEGPAGSGKTTAAVARLLALLENGVPGGSILLVLPQRTLATPYTDALHQPGLAAGGMVEVLTIGGLAQRMVDLFWPLVSEDAGFAHPDRPPTFLTLETAQYYMAHLVRPLREEGLFESVSIDPNRLYSQIIDNLNKAAVVGFEHTLIAEKLTTAWGGKDPAQVHVYQDAQTCANAFRDYCLEHNLLDFSLQLEVFRKHLWEHPLVQEMLLRRYRHLVVDNLEEDTPIAHDILSDWLPEFESALLIFDRDAGYRRFLGADPTSALRLREQCDTCLNFDQSLVITPELGAFSEMLGDALNPTRATPPPPIDHLLEAYEVTPQQVWSTIAFENKRYHPEMLEWVADQIAHLVQEEGVPPAEIAVLSPYLSDALRFSLKNSLDRRGIPSRSHRPSRSLREEPASLCLLTLAELAHPEWGFRPSKFDLVYTLVQAIDGMDLVRGQLLVEIVYRLKEGRPILTSFDIIAPAIQERITYGLGQRYEQLRLWIEAYQQEPVPELDIFLSRLFGEVLSRAGFGFHSNFDAGEVAANLIESAQKFRWMAEGSFPDNGKSIGQEYLEMVRDGVVAAQYIRSWQIQPDDAVLMAPAYTFLMSNRPVDFQFWLGVGSLGWFERLNQPLTHPYVLSRTWPEPSVWTDADELQVNQESLFRLGMGLVRRCRRRIYLGLSDLNEQGFEGQGPLLWAINRVLRQLPPPEAEEVQDV